jgi:hypothetical protein
MTTRFIGGCTDVIPGNRHVILNPTELVTQLLLFDELVLHSSRLQEFPQMIGLFGLEPVLELIASDGFTVKCDPNMLVIWRTADESIQQGKLLEYEFSYIVATKYRKYVEDSFQEWSEFQNFEAKWMDKLVEAVWPKIDTRGAQELSVKTPESKTNTRLLDDIVASRPIVRFAIARELETFMKIAVNPGAFEFKFEKIEEDTLRASTNIEDIYGLGPRSTHHVLLNALLRLIGIYSRFALIERYKAATTLSDAEYEVFFDGLSHFVRQVDSSQQTETFARVLKLVNFPSLNDLATQRAIKLDKILEIRNSSEIREFRHWIADAGESKDDDIKREVGAFRAKIGASFGTTTGKLLRLLVSTGIGAGAANPLLAMLTDAVASMADTFVVDSIVPKKGPVFFLRKQLPSIIDVSRIMTGANLPSDVPS